MAYKHRITQGLADLIEKYGGGGDDPMLKAVWWGLKGQVPLILQALDSSEEAIKEIEDKLREVLGIEEPIPPVALIAEKVADPTFEVTKVSIRSEDKPKGAKKPKAKKPKAKKPTKATEVVAEPTAEE